MGRQRKFFVFAQCQCFKITYHNNGILLSLFFLYSRLVSKFTQINKQYQSWKLVRNSWTFEILFFMETFVEQLTKIILEWNSEKLLLCYTVNNIRTASDALYPSLCFDYLSLQARFLFAANFLSGRFHLHL